MRAQRPTQLFEFVQKKLQAAACSAEVATLARRPEAAWYLAKKNKPKNGS
jgi:hypothetical protein